MPKSKQNIFFCQQSIIQKLEMADSSNNNLCWPAKIYLVILILSILFGIYQNFSVPVLLIKTVFGLLWLWLLHLLCEKGYEKISWLLLILPYVFMVLVVATAVEVVNILATDSDASKAVLASAKSSSVIIV